ncbi:MAG: HpcH/HpaI aldolase/citrate lyase family protein [Pseudomonadota bacterium]
MSAILPPENRFKRRLLEGEPLTGIWNSLGSPAAAEALSLVGYDWMLFDTEHAPVEISGLAPLLQASSCGTASAIVRPAWNDQVLIKRALDIGAQTLLIPFVQNAEEARAAVASMRYPPEGCRGVAGATRASRYGMAKGYLNSANEQMCCLVQIETGTAVDELEEIAGTPGVDGVFIGPSDLAASLGHLGEPSHPSVQAVLKHCASRLRAINLPAGILATDTASAQRYSDYGYQFIAVAVDIPLLANAASNTLEAFLDT